MSEQEEMKEIKKEVKKEIKKKRKNILGITLEILMLIILVITAISVVIGISGMKHLDELMKSNTENRIKSTCFMARDMIDGDRLEELLENGGDNALANDTRAKLQSICNNNEFNFLYIVNPDFPNGRVINYISAAGEMFPDLTVYSSGDVTMMSVKDYQNAYHAILDGEKDFELVFRLGLDNPSRDHITGLAPIYNSDGNVIGIMCAEIASSWYVDPLQTYIHNYSVEIIVVALISILICVIIIILRFSTPIKKINKEIDRFIKKKKLPEEKLGDTIKCSNEIGILADHIDKLEEVMMGQGGKKH